MSTVEQIKLAPLDLERFADVMPRQILDSAMSLASSVGEKMSGRAVWNINSTARGGGVAEMLRYLVAFGRGAGVDTRWAVIDGSPDFFRITKRLHNSLHGVDGDGSPLGEAERKIYEDVLASNATNLLGVVGPEDFLILHDPQTAGLIPWMVDAGRTVVWRCHIGHDTVNDEVLRGWDFLKPYLARVPRYVFSRAAYAPEFCEPEKIVIIPPSINPFSPKNQEMSEDNVHGILVHTGLIEGSDSDDRTFLHDDGSPGRVEHAVDVVRLGKAPSWSTPLIVQVSRWDDLKDPMGVIEGFRLYAEGSGTTRAHLILAGPNVTAVADDPEGAEVFAKTEQAWRDLPHHVRQRVHLASLPMHDVEENAAIVNALQRHASVVVQKSLHEGFGLTVTEAMWKGRPVVASAVGGIQDQIEDGTNGLLLKDPTDLSEFAGALSRLRSDRVLSARLGKNAQQTVRDRFLSLASLLAYGGLIMEMERDVSALQA